MLKKSFGCSTVHIHSGFPVSRFADVRSPVDMSGSDCLEHPAPSPMLLATSLTSGGKTAPATCSLGCSPWGGNGAWLLPPTGLQQTTMPSHWKGSKRSIIKEPPCFLASSLPHALLEELVGGRQTDRDAHANRAFATLVVTEKTAHGLVMRSMYEFSFGGGTMVLLGTQAS